MQKKSVTSRAGSTKSPSIMFQRDKTRMKSGGSLNQEQVADSCEEHGVLGESVVWEEKCQLLYPDVKFHGEFHVADNIALANKKTISDPKKFE
ncbi:hypothetical protein ACFX13_037741 [Malus domestica]